MALSADVAQAAAEFASRQAAKFGRRMGGGARDEVIIPFPDDTSALPTTIFIKYDCDGEVSERVLDVIKIWRTNDVVYVSGHCHLRRAYRMFRAERIEELICLATGEVASDPAVWLADHALFAGDIHRDYTSTALRMRRDELALLTYMARSDGVLDPDEIEVAIDLVMLSTDKDINRDKVAVYIKRLMPTFGELGDCVRRVTKDPARWATMMRAMRRLVDADEVRAKSEVDFWLELENLAELARHCQREEDESRRIAAEAEFAEFGEWWMRVTYSAGTGAVPELPL